MSEARTCTTITTNVGGAWAGSFKCTGSTGSSTVVITPGTAPHGWACDAYDNTTANVLRQTAYGTTSCTISGTVTSNDVITFKSDGDFENSLNEKTNSVVFPTSGASSGPGCALRASECAPTGDRRRGAEYGCTRIEPHHPRLQPSCQRRALHELCDHVHRRNAGNGVLDRNTDRAGWNNYLRWNTRPIHELGRMGCRGEFRLHHHALEWRELGSVLHLSGGKWWRRRRGSHQPELADWAAEPS